MERKRKDDKSQIRRKYKKQRDAMPDALVHQLSFCICENILGWEVYQNAKMVFFYYPLGKEVSLLTVINHAFESGKHVAFPKVDAGHMQFYEVTGLRELAEGCFHVMEPVADGKQAVSSMPDLCFVPGTAFDFTGGRFGYGRGYYDRYFAKKEAVKLAGCAFGCQIADQLPTDRWDVRMDYLLSETGIFAVGMETVPEPDEIEAIWEGRKDRATNGTVSHDAINWD